MHGPGPVFGAVGPLGGEEAFEETPLGHEDEPLHEDPPPPYHSVVLQSTVVSAAPLVLAAAAAAAAPARSWCLLLALACFWCSAAEVSASLQCAGASQHVRPSGRVGDLRGELQQQH